MALSVISSDVVKAKLKHNEEHLASVRAETERRYQTYIKAKDYKSALATLNEGINHLRYYNSVKAIWAACEKRKEFAMVPETELVRMVTNNNVSTHLAFMVGSIQTLLRAFLPRTNTITAPRVYHNNDVIAFLTHLPVSMYKIDGEEMKVITRYIRMANSKLSFGLLRIGQRFNIENGSNVYAIEYVHDAGNMRPVVVSAVKRKMDALVSKTHTSDVPAAGIGLHFNGNWYATEMSVNESSVVFNAFKNIARYTYESVQ